MDRQAFATTVVHAGLRAPGDATGAVVAPLSLSTTFMQRAPGQPVGDYEYARSGNPTRDALETALAALEDGTHGEERKHDAWQDWYLRRGWRP